MFIDEGHILNDSPNATLQIPELIHLDDQNVDGLSHLNFNVTIFCFRHLLKLKETIFYGMS